jgi:hypothetical protein
MNEDSSQSLSKILKIGSLYYFDLSTDSFFFIPLEIQKIRYEELWLKNFSLTKPMWTCKCLIGKEITFFLWTEGDQTEQVLLGALRTVQD